MFSLLKQTIKASAAPECRSIWRWKGNIDVLLASWKPRSPLHFLKKTLGVWIWITFIIQTAKNMIAIKVALYRGKSYVIWSYVTSRLCYIEVWLYIQLFHFAIATVNVLAISKSFLSFYNLIHFTSQSFILSLLRNRDGSDRQWNAFSSLTSDLFFAK